MKYRQETKMKTWIRKTSRGKIFVSLQTNVQNIHRIVAVDIQVVSNFLCDYVVTLISCGSHTSRVVRNAHRLSEALGYDVQMTIFQQHITIHVVASDDETARRTTVRKIPHGAFNFEKISRLSSLSWSAIDEKLSFGEVNARYNEIVHKLRIPPWVVLCLVPCANAAFCRLFSGDIVAMGLVFLATFFGFSLRMFLTKIKAHSLVMYVLVAFLASFVAGLGAYFNIGTTQSTGIATSVLFLIPGVQMINAILDVLEGYILMGLSRVVTSLLAVIGIAIGMVCTFYVLGI